jgi:hypothetical protein
MRLKAALRGAFEAALQELHSQAELGNEWVPKSLLGMVRMESAAKKVLLLSLSVNFRFHLKEC